MVVNRLPVRKYVVQYGSNFEARVLEAVKKYPTYSIDKLRNVLPEIKRHKIQRVLEKKGLSKLEERLQFSKSSRVTIGKYFKKDRTNLLLAKIKAPRPSFPKISPESRKRFIKSGAIVVGGILILVIVNSLVRSWLFAQTPIIRIQQPSHGSLVSNKKVFVSGQVEPARASVSVNGGHVALNGDGSFTAYIDVAVGENVLDIEAIYRFKKARVLTVIKRELSVEELETKAEEEKRRQELTELEQGADDVLAVRRARNEKDPVRVIKSSLVEEGKLSTIEGEVFNFGDSNLSFIQITATFLDEKGKVMDSKSGLAEGFGGTLQPGQKAVFETMPTSKKFYAYELSLEWEEQSPSSDLEASSLPEDL